MSIYKRPEPKPKIIVAENNLNLDASAPLYWTGKAFSLDKRDATEYVDHKKLMTALSKAQDDQSVKKKAVKNLRVEEK